jgi:hypothetical protein
MIPVTDLVGAQGVEDMRDLEVTCLVAQDVSS